MSHELITLEAEYEQESEYVVTTGDIIEWRHSAEPVTPRSEPATPPSASSAEKPRYLTRRLLGRGGMGEVRLCKDFRIGRSVAMKVLHPEARLDLTAQLRFVQEAQIQGQLEHPAIPPVYDLGMQPDGTLFFTMKRKDSLSPPVSRAAGEAGGSRPGCVGRIQRRGAGSPVR
ncbi:MAG: hypothetical protein U1A78_30450 [Polyangia bacterium]